MYNPRNIFRLIFIAAFGFLFTGIKQKNPLAILASLFLFSLIGLAYFVYGTDKEPTQTPPPPAVERNHQ